MLTTQHLSIFGRVQGVGYRESMRIEAQKSGCTGWVRNRKNGSVEAVVEGAPEDVARVVAWARRGPPAARVERVDASEAQGGFGTFEVLRTL